jgi:hypothetical protein
MNSGDSRVPIDQLPAAIEELLKSGPHVLDAVARELGYSVAAVRPRMSQLYLENRVHRKRVKIQAWPGGVCYTWHHGPGPDAPAPSQPRPALQAIVPSQTSVRTYPTINRRDPLVAALFGPARQQGTTVS